MVEKAELLVDGASHVCTPVVVNNLLKRMWQAGRHQGNVAPLARRHLEGTAHARDIVEFHLLNLVDCDEHPGARLRARFEKNRVEVVDGIVGRLGGTLAPDSRPASQNCHPKPGRKRGRLRIKSDTRPEQGGKRSLGVHVEHKPAVGASLLRKTLDKRRLATAARSRHKERAVFAAAHSQRAVEPIDNLLTGRINILSASPHRRR